MEYWPMSLQVPYQLHSVSVVITAESHNPSILDPRFLAAEGIVPSDWKVEKSSTGPTKSEVYYSDHGVRWMMEPGKTEIVETIGSPFDFREDYIVHRIADAYLAQVSNIPYRSLGLNCVISTKHDSPVKWLVGQFAPWLENTGLTVAVIPSFFITNEQVQFHIMVNFGEISTPQGNHDAVTINSNVHHQGPLDANALREVIRQWPERQGFLLSALDHILRGREI